MQQDQSQNLDQGTPGTPPTPSNFPTYTAQLEAECQRLTIELQQVRTNNHALQQSLHQAMQQQSSSPSHSSEPKLPLPKKFTGNRKDTRGFINQLELVFEACPTRFNSDQTRIHTLGSLLDGKPLNWLNPYLENRAQHPELFNNYATFKELFMEVWGEQERTIVSENRIRKLFQGHGSAAVYAAEFKNLAADLGWNDSALISQFRNGLSDAVKNLMLSHNLPPTLDKTIALAVKLDNRIFEHRLTTRVNTQPQFQSSGRTVTRNSNLPSKNTGPIPMDLSSMSTTEKRGPITAAEKERRKKLGLCVYCGGKHKLEDCNVRPAPKSKKGKSLTFSQISSVTQPLLGSMDETTIQSGKEPRH